MDNADAVGVFLGVVYSILLVPSFEVVMYCRACEDVKDDDSDIGMLLLDVSKITF